MIDEIPFETVESDQQLGQIKLHTRHLIHDPQRPTIVFLHDSLGSIEVWRSFPQTLCAELFCNGFIYDRQGHGQSDPFTNTDRDKNYLEREADALEQLMESVNLTNCVLFGHSDGGSIALIAAAKYPELASAVITEGAHVFVEDLTIAGIRQTEKVYLSSTLPEKLKKYHGSKTDALFRIWVDTWTKSSFRDFNMEHFLSQIACPVLVLQGESDEFGSIAQVQAIASQVAGIGIECVIPFARHTPHKEAESATLRAVADFIKTHVALPTR
jgi:pimeloyl-ACP methyl ester carboxylesterase